MCVCNCITCTNVQTFVTPFHTYSQVSNDTRRQSKESQGYCVCVCTCVCVCVHACMCVRVYVWVVCVCLFILYVFLCVSCVTVCVQLFISYLDMGAYWAQSLVSVEREDMLG